MQTMNEYIEKGEQFLINCVFSGLAHSFDVSKQKYVKPYPEVTGYIIKYFCENTKTIPANIRKAGDYLIKMQDKKTGGYSFFHDKDTLYAFDTSQILIGHSGLYEVTKKKKYKDAAIKAGHFLLMMQLDNGAVIPAYDKSQQEALIFRDLYSQWNGPWSGLMCKLTEGFQALYDLTNDSSYLNAQKRMAQFYVNADYIECTHPLGYWLEGLYAAGETQKVNQVLVEKVIPRIRDNGYIPYKEDLDYAYVSGCIQLGILLYKLGYINAAKKIRNYGRLVQDQNKTGGLFQYADFQGKLHSHIHSEINSWGTKYFCQLERLLDKEGI